MSSALNSFCRMDEKGNTILELKKGLFLFLEAPPSPEDARRVYNIYMSRWGGRIKSYCSTAAGCIPQAWNSLSQTRFENQELPDLRKRQHWGYGFEDGKSSDSWLFMFHGYRPHREAGKASFYRFSFPWDFDERVLLRFTEELLDIVPCLSGSGGYYFQGSSANLNVSYNEMFGLAYRYWGIDASDLDKTVDEVLHGIKSISWLTLIGNKYRKTSPTVVNAAKKSAFATIEREKAVVLLAEDRPKFLDVNRQESWKRYRMLAQELLPIQIQKHKPFSGNRWTAENTNLYIHRFTGGSISTE